MAQEIPPKKETLPPQEVADMTKLDSVERLDQLTAIRAREKKDTIIDQKIASAMEYQDTTHDFKKMDADELMEAELNENNKGLLAALFLAKNDGMRPSFFEDIENVQKEYAPGTEFTVDFKGNSHAEQIIGAGDMLPPQIRTIMTVDEKGQKRIGVRKNDPRVGYYDQNGYMEVFSKYKILIPTAQDIADMKSQESQVFFTNEEVTANSVAEKSSRETFVNRVKENKEKGRADFMAYLPMEFPEFASFEMDNLNLTEQAEKEDFQKIATAMNISKTEFPMLNGIFQAISGQESGGNYSALGVQVWGTYFGERAIGKYQIMPTNWRNWSKDMPSQFSGLESEGGLLLPSAKNQDLVAFTQMAKNFKKYDGRDENNRVQMVAASWFGNPGNAENPAQLSERNYYGISPKQYAGAVLNRYNTFMGIA